MEIVDAPYPYECTAGNYGNSFAQQSSPRCSGRGPVGHYCPTATVTPIECRPGTYCEEGSEEETRCPEGTFSAVAGARHAPTAALPAARDEL